MRDGTRIALAVLMFVVILVIVGFSIRSCADCNARGGVYVEAHGSWPQCVARQP